MVQLNLLQMEGKGRELYNPSSLEVAIVLKMAENLYDMY